MSKPFVNWVGGKSQLLPHIVSKMNECSFTRYVEPFLGGGAVFWNTNAQQFVLNDINVRLINAYRAVRDDVQQLLFELEQISTQFFASADKQQFFLQARASLNAGAGSPAQQAALFIFINKAGFNGLYRENKRGFVNTPYGHYEKYKSKISIYDNDTILNCHSKLQNCELMCGSFTAISPLASDFWFIDPPYLSLDNSKSNFTQYVANGFSLQHQSILSNLLRHIDSAGGKFILTNHNSAHAHHLYQDYKIQPVLATRTINSDPTKRGKSAIEIIVSNF